MGNTAPSKIYGQRETSFEDLPPETAIETLLRLPVKCLIRSTAVSKTWYSLIRNPNFVSAQIRRSFSCCDGNAFLMVPADISNISDKKYCSLISAETGSVISKYEIPFNSSSSGLTSFIGSVNGVLCLSNLCFKKSRQEVYLWNPYIKKYKNLVLSCRYTQCVLGFGFHEPTHDYRIVRFECGTLAAKVEVFSLQMNNWRNIENPNLPRVVFGCGTTINSSVYWADNRSPRTDLEEVWILYFDFNKEVFGQLKLSDDVRYCLGETANFQLMKYEDSLAVCVYKSTRISGSSGFSQPCCIWLMTHKDGIISWTMRFKVVLKESGSLFPKNPSCITKNGALILVSFLPKSPDTSIMSCDLKSMHYKYLGIDTPLDKHAIILPFLDTSFIESLAMLEKMNN